MHRLALAVAVFALVTHPALGKRAPNLTPLGRLATADAVVIGTVTGIEKETVDVEPYPGAGAKVTFSVAVVKVETIVHGLKNTTSVKVGFQPGGGARNRYPILEEGQALCLFLEKHPTAGFYTLPMMSPPLVLNDANREAIETIRKAETVYTDSLKALEAEKEEDRLFAAKVLVHTYRQSRAFRGGEWVTAEVPLDESQRILRILADSPEWAPAGEGGPLELFTLLNLTHLDKFIPQLPPAKGNAAAVMQKDFKKWLETDGKTYQIKKLVPKK